MCSCYGRSCSNIIPWYSGNLGPAIDNGFYYDFSREDAFTLDDLEKIEKKMHEIIDLGLPFEREVWDRKRQLIILKRLEKSINLK